MKKKQKQKRTAAPSLDCLPFTDPETGDLTVVVETPKDSHNKYKFDPECNAIRLSSVLAQGIAFPFDFGFFPSTRGEDGDPLDVLLFLDHAVPPGSVATGRLLGVLEVRQKKHKEPWTRNDRFLVAATHAHTHAQLKSLDDLRAHLLEEIETFFTHYAHMQGKELEVIARSGPQRARKLLKSGRKAFERGP